MTIVVMQSHEQWQKFDKGWTKSDMDYILTKVGQAITDPQHSIHKTWTRLGHLCILCLCDMKNFGQGNIL